MPGRRDAKKRETRQRISDVATGLFLARGFEAVTLDEVAMAAKVAKMTVFNYFPRKEDLMLDRHDDLKLRLLGDAIRLRTEGQSPVAALRELLGELRAQGHPFVRVDRDTVRWWRFIATSPSLQARLREFYDEAADELARELGGSAPDSRARLAAATIVATVRTAREELVIAFDDGASADHLSAAFLAVFEQGFTAVEQLMSGRSTQSESLGAATPLVT